MTTTIPTTMTMHGLPEIIRALKTFSSRRINETNPTTRFQWQKSYHDHIIRNDDSLNRTRGYIIKNPVRWGHENEPHPCG
jgi:REP element-mobilizing transposase RayT